MRHQQKRWILDITLFASFLICFFMDFTSTVLHQWIGLFSGLLAGYHLVSHWKWVRAVSANFFDRTSNQSRRFYGLDAAIAAGFVTMIGTGLVISTWFNLNLANYELWHTLHVAVSIGALAAVVLKIGLHAGWIVSAGRKFFRKPVSSTASSFPGPAETSPAMARREFLRVMGVVGLASFFAIGSSIQSLTAATSSTDTAAKTTLDTNSDTTSNPIAILPSEETASSSSTRGRTFNEDNSSSSTCSVRCRKGCSYPGHCHRYVDSDGNGLCDQGECAS